MIIKSIYAGLRDGQVYILFFLPDFLFVKRQEGIVKEVPMPQ